VTTRGPTGGRTDKAPRGTGPQDGGAPVLRNGGASAARDANGVSTGAANCATAGEVPQAGTEQANGVDVAPRKSARFGTQPGAADGAEAAHDAEVKSERPPPVSRRAD